MTHPYRRAVLVGMAATLLMAAPAAADPFFEPDEAPVDSLAELELDLAHGCFAGAGGHAHGDDAEEHPTIEVAVEVPVEVEYARPQELDGWELDVEVGDDERIVIIWTAEEGTDELAPVFELQVVMRGEVGDEVAWPVFQDCEEGSYRWVASADEPDGDPAPVVTLIEADPDAPPPDDPEGMVDVPEEPGAPEEVEEPDETEEAEETEEPTEDETEEIDPDEAADAGLPGWVLLVALLLVVVAVGGVLVARSRGRDGPGEGATS